MIHTTPRVRLFFFTLSFLVAIGIGWCDDGNTAPEARRWTEAQTELRGTLILVGGGSIPDAVRQKFVELAGGKEAKLVIIPSASTRIDDTAKEPWKRLGLKSVVLFHAKDKAAANDSNFLKPLTEATAVWLGGGDQSRLMMAYQGTGVERELHKLLERGGVIGGTSAGAAVMSKTMIAGGKTEAQLKEGFGFLRGFVVDQHFSQRQRLPRLLDALQKERGLVGLGIDEQTAVLVQQRRLSVLGAGHVTLCMAAGGGKKQRVETLKQGGIADVIALRRAALTRSLAVFPPAKPEEPRLAKGALLIGGGGRLPVEVMQRFIELAGGPESLIVFVPTALEDPIPTTPGEVRLLRQAGAKNIKVLHTRKREEANSPAFVSFLKDAKGVWFSGGRQWRFVDAYEGTLTEKAFHDLLARGGVIGGSSAGASIQSEYMPRGDPLGNRNIIAEGYERGFGFLKGVAIDQHFFVRRRQKDMTELTTEYPQLLGIGIDEGTVLLVQGSVMEVLGISKVGVFNAFRREQDKVHDYEELSPGTRYDLVKRERLP